MSKRRGLVALAFFAFALNAAFSQGAVSFPTWLVNYPGVTADVRSNSSLVETSYIADAHTMEVEDHYRALFEAHGLAFEPSWDGMGISVHAEAPECVLVILIRHKQGGGTLTKVSCAAKVDPSSYLPPSQIQVLGGHPKTEDSASAADQAGQHGKNKNGPPLEWPSWLTHIRGLQLQPQTGSDPTVLTAWYKTDASMSEISDFYHNLLMNHDYQPKGGMATGNTNRSSKQNATGRVSGINYPSGYPGAYTQIEVSMDRTAPDGPIRVSARFSTHRSGATTSNGATPSNNVTPSKSGGSGNSSSRAR